MTREKLISRYEKMLEKVRAQFEGDCRYEEYVKHAEAELEAVKNGRAW